MTGSRNEEFFHAEMESRTDTALDQLNHIIDTTFSSVEKFELFDRYTTLQLLNTVLDHQLQDGTDGSTGILLYTVYSAKVVELEAANTYD